MRKVPSKRESQEAPILRPPKLRIVGANFDVRWGGEMGIRHP